MQNFKKNRRIITWSRIHRWKFLSSFTWFLSPPCFLINGNFGFQCTKHCCTFLSQNHDQIKQTHKVIQRARLRNQAKFDFRVWNWGKISSTIISWKERETHGIFMNDTKKIVMKSKKQVFINIYLKKIFVKILKR